MTSTRRDFLRQLGSGTAVLGTASWAPGRLFAETAVHLPHSTPEEQGVSSAGILDFLDGIAKAKHELHSFMMLTHGKIVAQGWWTPYGPTLRHTMYSMSKSFTSTAVGFAVTEGRLTVEDQVISFFPDDLVPEVSENLKALKVKHLLTMCAGHAKEPTGEVVKHENWVQAFLAAPIVHEPGTVFQYNSTASYMLSAIVQKLTGQKVIDYLTPRLFIPLAIDNPTWETCPRGINTGGWGLSIHTEDMAKFGQLYLKKGLWEDRQILPAKWVEEATTFKIQQPEPAKPTRSKETNDWLQGYCYQFWRSQHHAFRGDGAFGQFTVVLPEKDAVIIMTGEDTDLQGELDLVWEHLLPAIKGAKLPRDFAANAQLRAALASLRLPAPEGKADSDTGGRISGKSFNLEANDLGLRDARFTFTNGECEFSARDSKKRHSIRSHFDGRWAQGETSLPGTPPRIISGGAPPSGTLYQVAGSCAWKDDTTLEMMWRYNETPHHDTATCQFDGDQVKIAFLSSIAEKKHLKDSRPVLVGKMLG